MYSQVYGENPSELKTLADVLKRLEEARPDLMQATMTFVMDRSIATQDNIELLKEKGYAYLLIERKPLQTSYEQKFETVRETFERIDQRMKDSDAVKKVPTADGETQKVVPKTTRIQSRRGFVRP